MPHKRNPITNERISGLARVVRGYAVPALENVVLWHERDISNSSAERVVLPDACILVDYMLGTFSRVVRDIRVNERRMAANFAASHRLYFSEKVLTALIEAGLSRSAAYALVQRNAMRSWETDVDFLVALNADQDVTAVLPSDTLAALFDPSSFLTHIDTAYERLGLEL
jgi:adenylosuccinate lyase